MQNIAALPVLLKTKHGSIAVIHKAEATVDAMAEIVEQVRPTVKMSNLTLAAVEVERELCVHRWSLDKSGQGHGLLGPTTCKTQTDNKAKLWMIVGMSAHFALISLIPAGSGLGRDREHNVLPSPNRQ